MMNRYLFLGLFLTIQIPSFSQDDSLRYAEILWSMKRKAFILQAVEFTEAEKAAFWPVYEDYCFSIMYMELENLEMERVLLNKQTIMNEKEGDLLYSNILTNEYELARLRKQFYRKFKRALAAKKAARIMQADNAFRLKIKLEVFQTPESTATLLTRLRD